MNTIDNKINKAITIEICEKISEQREYLCKTIGLLKVLNDALLFASDNYSDGYYYYTCSEVLLEKFLKICDELEDIEIEIFKLKVAK